MKGRQEAREPLQCIKRIGAIFLAVVALEGCGEAGNAPVEQGSSSNAGQPGEAFITAESGLAVGRSYVRQPAPGQPMVAAFVTLRNDSDRPFSLREVKSPRAAAVEVHRTVHQNGVMAMRQVHELVVPPQGELVLEPGGYHLMLTGVEGSLKPGETLPLRFIFEGGTTLDINAPVRRP